MPRGEKPARERGNVSHEWTCSGQQMALYEQDARPAAYELVSHFGRVRAGWSGHNTFQISRLVFFRVSGGHRRFARTTRSHV
jgi:hypothetical protein